MKLEDFPRVRAPAKLKAAGYTDKQFRKELYNLHVLSTVMYKRKKFCDKEANSRY